MTRLNKLLLAGTLVPALVLTPIAGAFAQAPDRERGAPGARPGIEAPRKGGAERGGGGMRGDGAPRGVPGARNAAQGAAPGGRSAEPHRAAETPMRTPNARQPAAPADHAPPSPAQRAAETGAPPARTPRNAAARPAGGAEPSRRQAVEPAPVRANPSQHPVQTGATTTPDRTQRQNAAGQVAPGSRMAPAQRPSETGAATPADRPRHNNAATQPGPGAQPNQRDAATPDDRARRDGADRAIASPRDRNDRNATAPQAPADAAQNRRPAPDTNAQGANGNRLQDGMRDDHGRIQNGDNRGRNGDNRGMGTGSAAALGAAAGFAGGFLAATGAQRLDDIRHDRHEVVEDGRTYIREPGRTIVEDGDRSFVVHDENDRFRELGYNVRRERRGQDYADVVDRPGGVQIVTYTDADGRMLRRVRRDRDGREFVLIDNGVDGRIRPYGDDIVDLPPPPVRIARDRYAVDYQDADEGLIYDTLVAPPLAAPPQRYTLDQIRYSPDVRSYVRSVDINTINFDSGSWTVPGAATGKLQSLATAIKRVVERNPNSVFLVGGYTDLTGNPTDNLSLSDRRAQSVAAILSKDFNVPPENLTTQGYGQQNPKVNTRGPSVENRRVVVQNITELLASGANQAPQASQE